MPADQAAGLRRRSGRQTLRSLHCFSDAADASIRLAQALSRCGWISLLVDTEDRLFADSPARSLFDWRQQLSRGQLQTLPMPYGDGWRAPGVRADVPELAHLAHGYDAVVFDAGMDGAGFARMCGASAAVIVEVRGADASRQRAYALLKSLSRLDEGIDLFLQGDAAACERVRSACAHFLGARFASAIFVAANKDDAFAALAVRMTGEETGLAAR